MGLVAGDLAQSRRVLGVSMSLLWSETAAVHAVDVTARRRGATNDQVRGPSCSGCCFAVGCAGNGFSVASVYAGTIGRTA